jgi:hypothetical protein
MALFELVFHLATSNYPISTRDLRNQLITLLLVKRHLIYTPVALKRDKLAPGGVFDFQNLHFLTIDRRSLCPLRSSRLPSLAHLAAHCRAYCIAFSVIALWTSIAR